jgi:sulfatase maturation enzyme AslB (radical SAM superfamily)
MKNQPFCAWPWFHQHVWAEGGMSPCCLWSKRVPGYDHDSFFKGEFMQGLRQQFAEHNPGPECGKCTYNESVGLGSQRLKSFEYARKFQIDFDQAPQLLSQEVNISNVCNIRCRSCNETRSTKWITEAIALGRKPQGLLKSGWSLSAYHAQHTKRLQFLGGEPLMHQDEIIAALRTIERYGNLPDVSLMLNSNLTLKFCDELVELMSKMRRIHIGCSIDGVEGLNDYIRSDSKWSEIVENLRQIKQMEQNLRGMKFWISTVYSVLNAHSFEQILDLAIDLDTKVSVIFCKSPIILDARNLPYDYKLRLIQKYQSSLESYQMPKHQSVLQSVISHLSNSSTMETAQWRAKFMHQNDILDQRRNVYLRDTVPELDALLRAS